MASTFVHKVGNSKFLVQTRRWSKYAFTEYWCEPIAEIPKNKEFDNPTPFYCFKCRAIDIRGGQFKWLCRNCSVVIDRREGHSKSVFERIYGPVEAEYVAHDYMTTSMHLDNLPQGPLRHLFTYSVHVTGVCVRRPSKGIHTATYCKMRAGAKFWHDFIAAKHVKVETKKLVPPDRLERKSLNYYLSMP